MTEYWRNLRKKVGHDPIIIPSTAGAIIRDNKILLVFHRQKQLWQIPGGLQEVDEKIADTIIREIKEELNLNVKVKELISVYSGKEWKIEFPNGDVVNQLLFFFLLDTEDSLDSIVIQKSEIEKYDFFDLDNPPEYVSDKTGAHVVGVDFSEEAINQAMKRTFGKKEKIRFIQCNIEDINLIDGNFDMILAVDALYDHFVDNIPEVLKKLRNLLADDGKLVVFQLFIAEKEEDAGSLDAENTYIGKALTENGFHYSVTDFTEDDKDHWKLKIQMANDMKSIFAEEGNIELYNFQINKAEKLLTYSEDNRGKRYCYFGEIR